MFSIIFFFLETNGISILIMCSQFWDMYKLIPIFLYDFCVLQIYDVSTGQRILKLFEANKANNYRENRATFNPTDELVLNDGVLWDIRSGKSIHKFDKFNDNISGVFHPMGLEIIINSEVVSFTWI